MKQKAILFVLFLLSTLTASAQTDLTGATISLSSNTFEYDGTAKEPKVSGIRKGTKRYNSLIEGTDYDIAYANNVNIGEASVTLTFKGEYTGVATKTFTISPIYVSSEDVKIELDKTEFTYDGTEKKPSVTVFYKDKLMVPGVDYEIAYSNNIEPGKATVTATFKGIYEGSAKSNFLIIGGNGIVVNETNFPDAAFRNWILNQKYGKDGLLTDEEIANVTSISITDDTSLKSLQGIELFTALKEVSFTGCSGLTSLRIPNGVTSIGNNAFRGCSGLTKVTIPNSVTDIGVAAFMDCIDLASVTIPNSVTSIGNYAFYGCYNMTSVTIGKNMTSIGDKAFSGCSSLTEVEINSNAIVSKAYSSSSSIKNIFGTQVKEYFIGNNVTSIGRNAFFSCSSLTSIIIPNSVTSIQEQSFAYCTSLSSIDIPNSVTQIQQQAFENCFSLTSVTIPNSVTEVGRDAFKETPWYNNQPNGLIYIGKVAYAYNGTMQKNTSMVLKEGTTSIGYEAFRECSGLTSIIIPNSVKSIEGGAFYDCSDLTEVTIGNSVTSIGKEAFFSCNNMTEVYCHAENVPVISLDVFSYVPLSTATLHVPSASVEDYKVTEPWSDFGSIVSLNGDVRNEIDFTNKVSFSKTGNMRNVRLVALMPAPVTNEYQEINMLQANCGNIIELNPANKLLFYDGSFEGSAFDVFESFKYVTKKVRIDFNKQPKRNEVTGVNPNDFLESDGTYINTNNNTIKQIGELLWSQSVDILDYAKRCYEYVASHYSYINGSWRTLEEIIRVGGGECGDFTTLFVNLMRYKGIPARHNIGVWVDGGYHVWPDFYHEDYGWVPVDPTFKNSNPNGDFFGRYDGNLIILSQGLTTFSQSDISVNNVPLQTFFFWYWYNSGYGNINGVHITSKDYQLKINLPGDVNGDEVVNGTDIQAIINLIVAGEYDAKADINTDGTVNGTDIQEVINIIVNGE